MLDLLGKGLRLVLSLQDDQLTPNMMLLIEKLLLRLFLCDDDALFLKDLVPQCTNLEEIADLVLEELVPQSSTQYPDRHERGRGVDHRSSAPPTNSC